MQEGTSSLMQMAKVSVAVQALHEKRLPFISVLCDPTFGGVSASYAMQADVRIAVSQPSRKAGAASADSEEPRIGFAGPAVILNTMCESNQTRFDQQCPADFQSASFVRDCGQIDMIVDTANASVEETVATIAYLLTANIHHHPFAASVGAEVSATQRATLAKASMVEKLTAGAAGQVEEGLSASAGDGIFNYTQSRLMDRPQTQDILAALLGSYIELSGDGKVGRDRCLRGGVGFFRGVACLGLGTFKGHTPTEMQNANYGMPSPHGYRTALRLMQLAEKFQMPVVTLVDTVGAWPTFECEQSGQSEAIATNLTAMAGLRVPIVTVLVGEGGSGGALGICMGNSIGMLSGGYFGVISPEGAASILGRYKDEQHKLEQFPKDCQALATAQCIYAHQLQTLGVVDQIIWEEQADSGRETYKSFPKLRSRIECFLADSLLSLLPLSAEELVQQRYSKYRRLGTFALLDEPQRVAAIDSAKQASVQSKQRSAITDGAAAAAPAKSSAPSLLMQHVAKEVVLGEASKYRKLAPPALSAPLTAAPIGVLASAALAAELAAAVPMPVKEKNAKAILDEFGAVYLCQEWLPKQSRVLVTDTTMRDAHQSLLATRVRSKDLVQSAAIASRLLADAFSLECWGGATFDVCMRFLEECPWERLRQLRAACPNVCLQMLIRGSNAVGYTSYPDNVVQEFIRLAALNGMDIFRIFDCFNDVSSMQVSIDAVLLSGKVAEVCICYTGNLLTSSIYTVEYYAQLAREVKAAGAHIVAVKDMAGLLRPLEVPPLMQALREAVGPDMAIHFHTHATSSGSLATCLEMARCGCNIIDFATASMADGTSQPSLNAFLAMMEGSPRDPLINFMTLEPYDTFWGHVRNEYAPFESGMKSGSARVFDHQIPGGQYSNLLVQCAGMGMLAGEQWNAVLDAYRDVNLLFGDIVKVTPSSKCVGDLALYLVLKNLTTKDLIDPATRLPTPEALLLDLPESVVGLIKGDLGFPHRGFPAEVVALVLRGNSTPQRTIRAGLALTPVDFQRNIADLSAQMGQNITPEQAMSSLMYPKVFSDYMQRLDKEGPIRKLLPTKVHLYAAAPGDAFAFTISKEELPHLLASLPSAASGYDLTAATHCARVELQRVSALQQGLRTVVFRLQLQPVGPAGSSGAAAVVYEEVQQVQVRDTGGVFVFDGPMADPLLPLKQLGSPMAGVVEKVAVKAGQAVLAGEVLCVVSAMKMEVKVSAPCDGIISSITVPAIGYRVVEGALLVTLK